MSDARADHDLPSGVMHRPVGIFSPFRPDYYEWFPVFGDVELVARLKYMTLAEATALVPRNIQRVIEIFPGKYDQKLKQFAVDINGKHWELVLIRLGFSEEVCRAFANVPRHNFVPNDLKQFAWANASIWLSEQSCLSAPGLIALVLEYLKNERFDNFFDIGYGSGYQTALLSKMFPAANFIGYEINPEISKYGKNNLTRINLANKIDLRSGSFPGAEWPTTSSTLILAMCGLPPQIYREWEDCLIPGQCLMAPRLASKLEFENMANNGEFRNLYDDYDIYHRRADYFIFSSSRIVEGKIKRDDILFDVSMVPYKTDFSGDHKFADTASHQWIKIFKLAE